VTKTLHWAVTCTYTLSLNTVVNF